MFEKLEPEEKEFSFADYSKNIKIKKIQNREGFYFFYVGVDPNLKADYKPYELVKIVNAANPSLVRLAVLESAIGLKGAEISDVLAYNLKLKEGDQIYFEPIQNVPGVTQIVISKSENQDAPLTRDITENNSYYKEKDILDSYQPTRYENRTEKSHLLVEYLKKTFNYSYVSEGHEFCFNDTWYKINVDENKKIQHFLILPTTKIKLKNDLKILDTKSIIGLEEPYSAIKEALNWPTNYASEYQKLNIEPSRGILLTGPPGCGKTHLVRQISKNTEFYFISVKGPEIISKYVGGSEKELRRLFEIAKKNQPAIIFFDEIDALGSKRSNYSENESKIVAQLLTLMDGLEKRGNVTIIAATNQPNLLDPSLRRPGRFDKEIFVKPPTWEDRKKLISLFLGPLAKNSNLDLSLLADKTPGFVHADIKYLVNEAKINVIRRKEELSKIGASAQELDLTMEDFEVSLSKMDPSILRQHYLLKNTKKTLDQIIGYDQVKEKLFDQIYMPAKYPNIFKSLSLKRVKGILLQGPPGTGKTSLAKALASELNYNFISLSASDINSMYVGESEQKIREVFKKAAMSAPVILFFDEIDAIFGTSDRIKNVATHDVSKTGQLLTEIDGALTTENEIILVGTTNKAQLLDPALLRPGRFDMILNMDYPNKQEVINLYRYNFKGLCEMKEIPENIIKKTLDLKMTGADIEMIKKKAIYLYLKTRSPIELKELEAADSKENLKIKLSNRDIEQAIDEYLKVRNKRSSEHPVDVTN